MATVRKGKRSRTARSSRPRNAGRRGNTGRRQSGASSRSASRNLKYAKWIDSPEDHEDRKGQSLATQNHEVIRQWAQSRKAVPATVGDTEGRGGAGVLRIDFPGYGGKRLKKVDWNDWFQTLRKLTFLYQEHKRDGSTSTFFKLAA